MGDFNWVVWAGRGRGPPSGIWVNEKPSDMMYGTCIPLCYFYRQSGSGCVGGWGGGGGSA